MLNENHSGLETSPSSVVTYLSPPVEPAPAAALALGFRVCTTAEQVSSLGMLAMPRIVLKIWRAVSHCWPFLGYSLRNLISCLTRSTDMEPLGTCCEMVQLESVSATEYVCLATQYTGLRLQLKLLTCIDG